MDDKALGIATQVIIMAIIISLIILFVGVLGLILIQLCLAGRSLRLQFENSGGMGRGSLGNSSMSRDDVEMLPSFNLGANESGGGSGGGGGGGGDTRLELECAICLDRINLGDKCRLLPTCNHSFHADCVDLWLLRTPFCPICRTSARFSRDPNTSQAAEG